MFEKWELAYSPTEKDKNRWRLRMKISDSELNEFIKQIDVAIGRPFNLNHEQYNWGIYLYNITDHERDIVANILHKNCSNGEVFFTEVKEEDTKKINVKQEEKLVEKQQETRKYVEPEIIEQKVEPFDKTTKKIIYEESELNPRYTFEDFVIGPNNRFTHAAAMAVAENPGKVYNPLFIYGGVGLGKTHLMVAIGHYVKKKFPSMKVLYVTTEKFVSEVIDSLKKGTLQQFREKYRNIDLLLVDDVQFLAESESTQEEFFHTFNTLHQAGKQIVLTSDRPPKKLTVLEDRLRSRFEWGLIADIKSPSLETRVAILKKKGENDNIKLDENILLYVASKLKSNVRELEGFLKRIHAYASITGQVVNIELVKEIMRELLPEEELDEELQQQMPAAQTPQQIGQKIPQPPQYTPQPQYIPQPTQPQYIPPQYIPPQPQYIPQQPPQYVPPQTQPPQYIPQSPQYIPQPTQPQYIPQQQNIPVQQPQITYPTPQQSPYHKHQSPQIQQQPQKPDLTKFKSSPNISDVQQQQGQMPTVTTPVSSSQSVDSSLKPLEVAFFYPEGKDKELAQVKDKFREVIKKHNLKFRLESVFDRSYNCYSKINFSMFVELCKTNKVNIAIILGPPPDAIFTNDDFMNTLSILMNNAAVSMQFLPWSDLNKDYRYLNLALDITLIKHSVII